MEIKPNKILQKYPSPYYTRQNLSLLLGDNRRTLDARLATLIKSELLLPLKSGFYLNLLFYNQATSKSALLEYLGSLLVTPSYLSLEYVISSYGFLAENVTSLTYVTTKKTRVFTTPLARFSYRKLKESLFTNYQSVQYGNFTYYLATLPKAIFDFIYFSPLKTQKEAMDLLADSRFNWEVLSPTDKKELSYLLSESASPKLIRIHSILKKQGIV